MSAQHTILIFDSGVGGLSIVQHLRKQCPDSALIYLADNAFFPYGLLPASQLIARVSEVISRACQRYRPDVVIIACNTASTLVLTQLREQLAGDVVEAVDVVGVVPAIKPAAAQSQTKVIGLLATPGTIARDYTDELISDFAGDCDIIRLGSAPLVAWVEGQLAGPAIEDTLLADILAPFWQHPQGAKIDTIVLACTHFPLVLPQLKKAAPHIHYWVDSGDAIARRVKQLRSTSTAAINQPSTKPAGGDVALFTAAIAAPSTLASTFKKFGFDRCQSFD